MLDGAVQVDQTVGWRGTLALELESRGGRTVLARRRHEGPLGVQRPFHPEPDGTCHLYVLHPPGGVVAGDELELTVTLAENARALLTTPAATKLYTSHGNLVKQRQSFRVSNGARLEWLPLETIAYAGARAELTTSVELEDGAHYLGWEILCLGRPAAGERFDHGLLTQRLEVRRGGKPLVLERARYEAGSAIMSEAWGLRGQPVVGSLVCVIEHASEDLLAEVRAALSGRAGPEAACSQLAGALVCRYLGPSVERAHQAFRAAFTVLRHRLFGIPPILPRIFFT